MNSSTDRLFAFIVKTGMHDSCGCTCGLWKTSTSTGRASYLRFVFVTVHIDIVFFFLLTHVQQDPSPNSRQQKIKKPPYQCASLRRSNVSLTIMRVYATCVGCLGCDIRLSKQFTVYHAAHNVVDVTQTPFFSIGCACSASPPYTGRFL
jgi:hypothetical protein